MTIRERIILKAYNRLNTSYSHFKQALKAPDYNSTNLMPTSILKGTDKPLDKWIKEREAL